MGHSKIVIPMYNDITNEIKNHDEFGETFSHLRCNQYKTSYTLLNQIEKAQKDYNQYVSSLFSEYEMKIIDLLQTVENFKIVNREYFLSIIFDYLYRLSKDEKLELTLKVESDEVGFFHCTLHPSHDEKKILVDALNLENKLVKRVKELLDGITPEIVERLKKINEKDLSINGSFTEFKTELKSIIHNAEILGIDGDCKFEDKIIFKRRFVNFIKSLFRLKRSN